MADAAKSGTMFVITNKTGKIIAAFTEDTQPGTQVGITPEPSQRMHKIDGVPERIFQARDGAEFHKLITEHFKSKRAQVTPVDYLDYINTNLERVLKEKKENRPPGS
jgi:hypothetical protein